MGNQPNRFVSDGPARFRDGLDLEQATLAIEAEVSAEFASRVAEAGVLGRWWLSLRRGLEIRRRVKALEPGRHVNWAKR